ncbi:MULTISPECIES: putative phage tail protein [Clostridium]|uniref:putative phage tail protein n=1 Tax=Clostridium TaxID=1485 RepID=UPI0013E8F6BA|nr:MULTISPECIES: putative phage tail protein [Clostridium]MBZ9637522.1 YmfQ family protein [Clostridium sp. FP1]MCB2300941.1 YmfQ family protein [Clostridium tagluense]
MINENLNKRGIPYAIDNENSMTIPEKMCPNLMNYLPQYLHNDSTIKALQKEVLSKELGRLNFHMKSMLEQCFIDTVTKEAPGLKLWEQFLGIPIDENKPVEYRKSVIKAKVRGTGTVTKKMINQVASAYSNCEVEIIEKPEEYKFIVKFIGGKGIPPNMLDLTKTIEEIKPVHLRFEYEYTYCIWDWCKSYNYTWNDMKSMTWGEAKTNINRKGVII